MNAKQQRYIQEIIKKGRLLSDDEAFEYYVENIMTVPVTCRVNHYNWTEDGKRFDTHEDYSLEELTMKARQWHKFMVGGLVLCGALSVGLGHGPRTDFLATKGFERFVR